MGKSSQSRPSRKERKGSRERRGHALEHGLPATEPPAQRPRRVETAQRRETASVISAPPVARVAGNDVPKPPWARFKLSAVPMQLRVLLGAVVVLIAIGLYRRSAEDSSDGGAAVVAIPDTVAVPAAQPEPPPAAELPRDEAPRASELAPEAATAPQVPVAVPEVRPDSSVITGRRPNPAKGHKTVSSGTVPVPVSSEASVPVAMPVTPTQKATGASNATPPPDENPY